MYVNILFADLFCAPTSPYSPFTYGKKLVRLSWSVFGISKCRATNLCHAVLRHFFHARYIKVSRDDSDHVGDGQLFLQGGGVGNYPGLEFFLNPRLCKIILRVCVGKSLWMNFFKVKHRTWLVERTCSSVFFFFSYIAPLTRFFWRKVFALQNFFLEIGPPQKNKNGPSIICMIMSRCF